MLKTFAAMLALGILCSLAVGPASAQDLSDAANTSTDITLGGQVVMRIRTGAGGYSAEQRALAVQHRLIPILSLRGLNPSDVTVQIVNVNQSNIMVRGRLLLTVDQTLAKANGETPAQLAQAWSSNLRQTLPEASVSGGDQYHQGQL